MVGTVVSTKCSKSITVQVIRSKFIPKYHARINVRRKVMAHDEEEIGNVGDVVRIVPCRPMSRKKRHKLMDIIRRSESLELDENNKI